MQSVANDDCGRGIRKRRASYENLRRKVCSYAFVKVFSKILWLGFIFLFFTCTNCDKKNMSVVLA